MRRIRRARRPLVALVALVLALALGYGIRALHDRGESGSRPSGTPHTSAPATPVPHT